MLKNFQENFIKYCNSENFEINQSQIAVIKKLENFYKNNFKSIISNFFSKEYTQKSFYLAKESSIIRLN